MTPEGIGSYADEFSVGLAVFAFFAAYIVDPKNRTDKAFPSLLAKAAAIAVAPQALVMIYGAFRPEIIAKVGGLRIAIAFGGISLLWIALKAFRPDDQ